MDISDILVTCKAIHQSGKTPSMGLIKARLSSSAPLPLIVSALKQWKEMSEEQKQKVNITKRADNTNAKPAQSDNERIHILEKEVVALKHELKEMKTLLQASMKR